MEINPLKVANKDNTTKSNECRKRDIAKTLIWQLASEKRWDVSYFADHHTAHIPSVRVLRSKFLRVASPTSVARSVSCFLLTHYERPYPSETRRLVAEYTFASVFNAYMTKCFGEKWRDASATGIVGISHQKSQRI